MQGYILINIPTSCEECQLCVYDDILGFWCHGTCKNKNSSGVYEGKGGSGLDYDLVMHGRKPDWCPIKELPKTKYEHSGFVEEDCICFGYNLCLEDILGAEK